MLLKKTAIVLLGTVALSGVGTAAHAKPLPPAEEDAGICRPYETLVGATCLNLGLPRIDRGPVGNFVSSVVVAGTRINPLYS